MRFEYIYGIKAWDKYPNVNISIEIITPETALAMLETNVNNREMKREPLVEAIKSGEWCLNGETIVFADDGTLLDGQNRLYACVVANIPIVSIVVRGIAKSAQVTMDSGVKRQVADYLKMLGYKDPNVVAAIGTAMLKGTVYGIESAFSKKNSDQFTTKQIVSFIVENYESRIKPVLSTARAAARQYKGLSVGTVAVLFEVFKGVDIESFEHFAGMLAMKYDPVKPVRLLISRLSANAQSQRGRLPQRILAAYIVKAWNAYMRGEDISQLKVTLGGAHPEQFPEIFRGYE